MSTETLLKVESLCKSFDARHKIFRRKKDAALKVYAVDNVSFELKKGEVIGLIGESGCGKSTTAKLLLKLLEVDDGRVLYSGSDVTTIKGDDLREYRKKIQIVFQDPYEYLNPRINIMEIITEPLVIHKMVSSEAEKRGIAIKYLEIVGLVPGNAFISRFSHELSGGQRQRVAIARALVMNPELIVADEPTSMLDVSVRAGILNLLLGLKEQYGMSMVFITHDITTAGYMCDRIAVMYKGRIVEIGSKNDIIFKPKHPYTKALVSVAMNLEEFLEHKEDYIKDGEVDSYLQSGYCSFEKRCIYYCDKCSSKKRYELTKVGEDHYVACIKV